MSGRRVLLAIVLFVAVTCTYANHFGNGFHFDDSHAIVQNPFIRDLGNVARFFTDATLSSVVKANQTYRPVVSTTLAVDYALGGGYVPFWFQLSTFLVFLAQLAAMLVLFGVIVAKAGAGQAGRYAALFAVAVYALHPANAETLNYIVQRADVYSTFGVVLGLALYARLPRLRRTGLYLLPVLVALLSKPPAVVFALLLFSYRWLFEEDGERSRSGSAALRALPALALCLGMLVVYHFMTPPSFLPSIIPASSYIASQPYVLLRYVVTFFAPFNLSVDTDLQPLRALSQDALLGDAFALAAVVTAVVAGRRREWRPVAFGLWWFLIASIPTSVFPLSELENDHRMFFPFVGLAIAVSWAGMLAVRTLAKRRPRLVERGVVALGLVVLSLEAAGTVHRNATWHSDETLWADGVAKSPQNGRAHMNYGLTQMAVGRYDVALAEFQKAAVLAPNYASLEINLGIVEGVLHHEAAADGHFLRAIALAPNEGSTHYYYARHLRELGRIDSSLSEAETAVRDDPPDLDARTLLMQDDLDDGLRDAARAVAAQTLAYAPRDPQASAVLAQPVSGDASYWVGVSSREFTQGRYRECIAAARRALGLRAGDAEAYNNIGAAEQSLHEWDAAIAADRRAIELEPTLQIAKNNLAWSLGQRSLRHR